jgi:hypothetical protein
MSYILGQQHGYVKRRFSELFHGYFPYFYDSKLTVIFNGNIKIDLYKFEDWIYQENNINIETSQESLQDIIIRIYGEEALHFIEELL